MTGLMAIKRAFTKASRFIHAMTWAELMTYVMVTENCQLKTITHRQMTQDDLKEQHRLEQ